MSKSKLPAKKQAWTPAEGDSVRTPKGEFGIIKTLFRGADRILRDEKQKEIGREQSIWATVSFPDPLKPDQNFDTWELTNEEPEVASDSSGKLNAGDRVEVNQHNVNQGSNRGEITVFFEGAKEDFATVKLDNGISDNYAVSSLRKLVKKN